MRLRGLVLPGVVGLVLVLVATPGLPAPHATGTVEGEIVVKKGSAMRADRSGVVVSLEGVPPTPGKKLPPMPAIMQKDKQFVPALTVVPKGTTVDFPNQDKIFHNVFSVSRPARFDLGLYKSGSSKQVEFKRTGVVDVYCNIHPEMVAKVRVVDGEFFTITGRDGKFKIAGVPPGTYPIVAWTPGADEVRGKVTVVAGGSAKVSLEITAGARDDEPHQRKDGTPYGRYK